MLLNKVCDYEFKKIHGHLNYLNRFVAQSRRVNYIKWVTSQTPPNIRMMYAYYIHHLISDVPKLDIATNEVPNDSTKYRTTHFLSFYEALKHAQYNRDLKQELVRFIYKGSVYAQRVFFIFTSKRNLTGIPLSGLRDLYIELELDKMIIENPEIECKKKKGQRKKEKDIQFPLYSFQLKGKFAYFYKVKDFYKSNLEGDVFEALKYASRNVENMTIEGVMTKKSLQVWLCTSARILAEKSYVGRNTRPLPRAPSSMLKSFESVQRAFREMKFFQPDMVDIEPARGSYHTNIESLAKTVEKGTYTLVTPTVVEKSIKFNEPLRKVIVDFDVDKVILEDDELTRDEFIGKIDNKLIGKFVKIIEVKGKRYGILDE